MRPFKNNKFLLIMLLISIVVTIVGCRQRGGTDIVGVSEYIYVPIDNYVAIYENTDLNNDIKEQSFDDICGDLYYSDEKDYYKLKGIDNVRYLICESESNQCLIWEFQAFETRAFDDVREKFPYAEFKKYKYDKVLKLVYGLKSNKDILKIEINPSKEDNSVEGKRLQDEIGTHIITDTDDIQYIYQVFLDMYCDGLDSGIDVLYEEFRSQQMEEKVKKNPYIRSAYNRYLKIYLCDGSTIDSLKYSAVGGAFYEYGGITYNILEDEVMEQINSMMKIDEISKM